MRTVKSVQDVAGKAVEVGDTVVTVNGQTTGRICEIAREDDETAFVAIRPVFHSYGKGVWYAADQVFWVARPGEADKKKKNLRKKTSKKAQDNGFSGLDADDLLPNDAGAGSAPVIRSRPARKK